MLSPKVNVLITCYQFESLCLLFNHQRSSTPIPLPLNHKSLILQSQYGLLVQTLLTTCRITNINYYVVTREVLNNSYLEYNSQEWFYCCYCCCLICSFGLVGVVLFPCTLETLYNLDKGTNTTTVIPTNVCIFE